MQLRGKRTVDHAKLVHPAVNKLIQLPKTPAHVSDVNKSNTRGRWIVCLFHCYDKIHNNNKTLI